MKFTLSWLREHLDTDANAATIADTLTRIGLEVEGVENPAEALRPFTVARVLTAERHPQADKLQVLTVDTGDGGEPLQVVCGAPNARAGLVGVFGGPGTYVPGSDFTLKKAAIRGVESNGMMCSARELQLGEDHDGIIELPADAPVGTSFADYAGLDEAVFDVAVTPNRPDCMGVDGIARDLAAAGLGTFKPKGYQVIKGKGPAEPKVIVEPDSGCYVFWRRLIRGVRNGPSPEWLQQRLKAVGLRPISALVDITNFYSVDQARPLHVYDAAKLKGPITVRRGRKGDHFMALNDKEYAPTAVDCVISDESGAIGLGGIVGGESTGVDEHTTDVLLECAWFDPEAIARTGQRHAISTDARSRFERGIDPMKLSSAIESAAQMIIDLAGGEASEPVISGTFPTDGYPNVTHRLVHRPERVRDLGGIDLPVDEQRAILGRLGFLMVNPDDPESWENEETRLAMGKKLAAAGEGAWIVAVPTWRPDVDGPADLVEEVTRIVGYDQIPSAPLPRAEGVAHATATRSQMVERKVRRAAAARGLDEAVTWSFIGKDDAELFGGATHIVANPISEDMKYMRPSMIPGLAAAARRNADRGASSIRLFELGRRYLADAERPTVAILLAGDKAPRSWLAAKGANFDAFDAKAEVMALLDAAGAPTGNLQLNMGAGDTWHPGRSATLGLGKTILAAFGELHPRIERALEVPAGTVAAEIYLDAIPAARSSERARPAFTPPALQAISRDFAFIVPADLAADALVRAIRGADKALITDARLFDRFDGAQGLSLAVEVTLQPSEKSFTDAEIGEVSKKVIAAAEKLGATLRG
ncbi:phenylalanine--tRNA ligase subunit beta [Sphingomonas sp.]|uniref:phenylalanine--tRNA ligase subunit beta n=1 Tax=Sphingomonas sp. TaxID=28214 RepID=UPI0025FC1BDC|nr:phenylalanine--tRNA ligase subunit beta [Sphingomonas sp.]